MKRSGIILLTGGLLLGGAFVTAGCEEAKVTEKTEVKDKIGGGEKVEKTRVTETDDKVRVEKEKTDIGRHGDVKSAEKTVTESDKPK